MCRTKTSSCGCAWPGCPLFASSTRVYAYFFCPPHYCSHSVDPQFPDGLRNGTYEVQIANNYPTTNFGNGTKSVLVTSTSFIGGKNPFLGYAYIAVGSLCLLLAIVFFVVNLVTPRRLGDPSLLSWNRMQGGVFLYIRGWQTSLAHDDLRRRLGCPQLSCNVEWPRAWFNRPPFLS